MRWPCSSSSAMGTRRRCDQSRKASACTSGGAAAAGSERWIRSPQAAMRSLTAAWLRMRSWSRWRWTSQPDAPANNARETITVSQMRR